MAPLTVRRQGVTGALAGNAVDMTLRLDNADALDHMPTATTTATDDLRSVIKEVGAGNVSNQEQPSSGPTDGVASICPPLPYGRVMISRR